MKRKVLFSIIVAVVFLLAACGTSPQKRYASEMEPGVEILENWRTDFAGLQDLLQEGGSNNIPRNSVIEFYNIAAQYYLTRDDYVKGGFSSLDDLVAPSNKLSEDGHKILNIISIVTPVEEMQATHDVILKCVKLRVALTEELASALTSLRSIDLSQVGDPSDCDTFDAAYQKLSSFVNENK